MKAQKACSARFCLAAVALRFAVCTISQILLIHPLLAEVVAVSHPAGVTHGFLAMQSQDGHSIASGDMDQTTTGNEVTAHVVFRFKDGSIDDETVVYSQQKHFRLLRYHLVQKGAAYPHPLDLRIDAPSGQVTVHYTEDGKERVVTQHLDLPPDLANGMIPTLLQNIPANAPALKVSMLAATPKPRLVKLAITNDGEDPFFVGTARHKATHFIVRLQIGGIAGLLAPLLGKQPPDTHVWIMRSEAPVFVKSEGARYLGGPIWRIELAKPSWPA